MNFSSPPELWRFVFMENHPRGLRSRHLPCKHEDLSSNPKMQNPEAAITWISASKVPTGRWVVERKAAQQCQKAWKTEEKTDSASKQGRRQGPTPEVALIPQAYTYTHIPHIHTYIIHTEMFLKSRRRMNMFAVRLARTHVQWLMRSCQPFVWTIKGIQRQDWWQGHLYEVTTGVEHTPVTPTLEMEFQVSLGNSEPVSVYPLLYCLSLCLCLSHTCAHARTRTRTRARILDCLVWKDTRYQGICELPESH